LLVALARLARVDALLEAVVAGDEQLLDARAGVFPLHKPTLTGQISRMENGDDSKPISVLIADDHQLFAEALQAILMRDRRIEVIGQAHDGYEAVLRARELRPDVILMDISMPLMDGIEATRMIRAESDSARVLMLTGSNSRLDVDSARSAGAAGYITKDRIAAELIDAIVELASR
jgi:CheY-like chemotaxis protein